MLTCLRVLTLSWIGRGKPTRVSVSLQNNEQLDLADRRHEDIHKSSIRHLLSQSETDELVSAGLEEVLDVLLSVDTQTHSSQTRCHFSVSEPTKTRCISLLKAHQSRRAAAVCAEGL